MYRVYRNEIKLSIMELKISTMIRRSKMSLFPDHITSLAYSNTGTVRLVFVLDQTLSSCIKFQQ